MAGMRRSEVSALGWADVDDDAGDGVLVTVRRKTNQEGETRDFRFVKDAVAREIRTLTGRLAAWRPSTVSCRSRRRLVGLRFKAPTRDGGGEHVTAHSGRVGLV